MTLAAAAVALLVLLAVAGFIAAIVIYGIVGAITIFGWSAEGGAFGIVAYAACWLFLFPLMLAASVVVGAISPR